VQTRYVRRDRVAQFRNAEIWIVERFSRIQRRDRGRANVSWRNFVRFAEPERQDVGIAHARVGDFTDFGRNQRAHGGSSTEADAGMQRRVVHRMFVRDLMAQPPLYWEVGVRARQGIAMKLYGIV